MIIGIPKEIKTDENRVSITPAGVYAFKSHNHTVLVQKGAGIGSGISDLEYEREGARIVPAAEDIFTNAEMIIKVKEPQRSEISMLQENQILYTFLHLAPDREQTTGLLNKKIIGIAYETIEENGKLVLLEPMSEIAGKMAPLMAAFYSAKQHGGSGILAGGVVGVHSANFLILGGGTAGINAAKIASGLGAKTTVLDVNLERMRYLDDVLPMNCEMIMSNRINIENEITTADVIIGTVLIPGAKTPKLITKDMLKKMKPGSVVIDVSIDQGGCVETSHATTHSDPVFTVDTIVHYCVANMPGAYPRTATFALTNATLSYGLCIANAGWKEAARQHAAIAKGINVAHGCVTYKPVAEAHTIAYTPLSQLL